MMQIYALSRIAHVARYFRVGLHYTAIRLKGVKGLELRMPALSPTMSEGTIIKWLKKEGDPVTPGDALCEIQTDKAVMTLDTEEEGVLAKILLPDDSKDIKIGTLIAMLVEEGQDWKEVEVPTSEANSATNPSLARETRTSEVATQDRSKTAKFTMGPATKKLLLEYGLEQYAIVSSGPRGTLLKGDVLKYVNSKNLKPIPAAKSFTISLQQSAAAKYKPGLAAGQKLTTKTAATGVEQVFLDVPNSDWRMTLAASAVRSKTTIPHSYCSVDCEVDDVLRLIQTLKDDTSNVSLNDFVIKAAAVALQRVPEVNAQRTGSDDHVHLVANVDVAVDVHTDDLPHSIIIRDAIGLGVTEISERTRDLTGKGIDRLQSPIPLTVSNLGSFGVTEFAEIVREHQTAVLAVGTSRITLDDGGSPRWRLTATLSYDARVFNEEIAAKFLSEFASTIGNPSLIFVSLGPSTSDKYESFAIQS